MNQLDAIALQKGATALVSLDLSDFDMQGGYVLFTVKEKGGEVIREWRFSEAEVHNIVFEDEFTAILDLGKHLYEYEIMWHVDGERFAQCAPSPIEVTRTLGGYPHGIEV